MSGKPDFFRQRGDCPIRKENWFFSPISQFFVLYAGKIIEPDMSEVRKMVGTDLHVSQILIMAGTVKKKIDVGVKNCKTG